MSDLLWHCTFNPLGANEQLVRGHEHVYFGHQFDTKTGNPKAIPDYAAGGDRGTPGGTTVPIG